MFDGDDVHTMHTPGQCRKCVAIIGVWVSVFYVYVDEEQQGCEAGGKNESGTGIGRAANIRSRWICGAQ